MPAPDGKMERRQVEETATATVRRLFSKRDGTKMPIVVNVVSMQCASFSRTIGMMRTFCLTTILLVRRRNSVEASEGGGGLV